MSDQKILAYNGNPEVPIDEKFAPVAEHVEHVQHVHYDQHGHVDHVNITSDGVAHIDASIAAGVAANVEDYETLVREASEATARESQMSVKTAFKTYPKAIGWSLLLSTAIIMEGYDTALQGPFFAYREFAQRLLPAFQK